MHPDHKENRDPSSPMSGPKGASSRRPDAPRAEGAAPRSQGRRSSGDASAGDANNSSRFGPPDIFAARPPPGPPDHAGPGLRLRVAVIRPESWVWPQGSLPAAGLRAGGCCRAPIENMEELKQRIAQAGAGDIQRLLTSSNLAFQPREAAFTALVTQCARAKAWEKALAVFSALRATPGMTANTISYSAVISACSSAGRWQEAEQLFGEMAGDGCSPNAITFSCLISACERGGQFDRALDWFQRMQASGVQADGIIYRQA